MPAFDLGDTDALPLIDQYRQGLAALEAAREAGTLADAEEDRRIDLLDEMWSDLSTEEQDAVRAEWPPPSPAGVACLRSLSLEPREL